MDGRNWQRLGNSPQASKEQLCSDMISCMLCLHLYTGNPPVPKIAPSTPHLPLYTPECRLLLVVLQSGLRLHVSIRERGLDYFVVFG